MRPHSPLNQPQLSVVRELQARLREMEEPARSEPLARVGTGCAEFDALWPAGGVERGTLVEWFPSPQAEHGSGCATLALVVARQIAAEGGALVVVDRAKTFYPPAALALKIARQSLIIVRPASAADELWAIDQALRSSAVAAVWAPLKKLSGHDFRRLQLAAEQSGAVGLFIRPAPMRWQPSWAHVQIVCTPRRRVPALVRAGRETCPTGRRLGIEVIRVRGGTLGAAGRGLELEMDDTTGELHPRASHVTHSLPPLSALAAAAADCDSA
jgi:hypothetical protein